jgi:hypothetical protein
LPKSAARPPSNCSRKTFALLHAACLEPRQADETRSSTVFNDGGHSPESSSVTLTIRLSTRVLSLDEPMEATKDRLVCCAG